MAALTDAEITKLQNYIIPAFTNAKRISDLEVASDGSPLDMYVEILDKNGETKKCKVASLLPYVEDQLYYGVEWDTTVSTTAMTRIGNSDLHKSLPIQSRMRGCLLADDGTPTYLNPTNWLAYTLDGSAGQLMVEIPAHYRKFVSIDTKRQCRLSEYPIPGYTYVPKVYISAMEASLQRSTGKLCSVVNTTTDYRGGANQSDWDGTYKTLLGRAVSVLSRPAFRNAARLRNGDTKWNMYTLDAHQTMCWLYFVEYADRNSQLAFNSAKTSEGYMQGGLGNGVSTYGDWGTFNGAYPFVPCGHTNSLGNYSGEVKYDFVDQNGAAQSVMVNRYRGIENPFGHIWKHTDGVNIEILTDADGGTSKVYTCSDPAKFTDSNYSGYVLQGLEARDSGYVKDIIFNNGCILPSAIGGGTTSYWCDYHYTSVTSSSMRGLLLGGSALHGADDGLVSCNSGLAPAIADADIGSRLCYIP